MPASPPCCCTSTGSCRRRFRSPPPSSSTARQSSRRTCSRFGARWACCSRTPTIRSSVRPCSRTWRSARSSLGSRRINCARSWPGRSPQVRLGGFESRSPHHLSLGEKRRVCLAGVLACEPSLLVLDEPTSGLDPRGKRELIELLSTLSATRIVASHDLDMIAALCSRVFVLDQGLIVADGPTQRDPGGRATDARPRAREAARPAAPAPPRSPRTRLVEGCGAADRRLTSSDEPRGGPSCRGSCRGRAGGRAPAVPSRATGAPS